MIQQSTNSLLGYPEHARLLIINADDFGMCHSNNEATISALTKGVATSTTLMAPCPWAADAIRLLGDHPDIAFGVHLTIISEHSGYRWGPLASKSIVPSLIDESGCFYRNDRRDELLSRALLSEVEIEFRTQIATVLLAGLKPTHLDFHCLGDGGRGDIFDLTASLAKENGLALRVHDRARADDLRGNGFPVNDHPILDSYSLESSGKSARYATLLRNLPPGLTEWAVHPSLGNAESQAMEPESWQVRKADFDFILSDEARSILDQEGIITLNYRPLQMLWSNPQK